MELPFTGFELTFIVFAFTIFFLFSLASVCVEPDRAQPGIKRPLSSDKHRQMSQLFFFFNIAKLYAFSLSEKAVHEVKKSRLFKRKQRVITKEPGQMP